jgi:hypothetical protein
VLLAKGVNRANSPHLLVTYFLYGILLTTSKTYADKLNNSDVTGPIFRREGLVTFGNGYGHGTGTIDMGKIMDEHDTMYTSIMHSIDAIWNNTSARGMNRQTLDTLQTQVQSRLNAAAQRLENIAEMYNIRIRSDTLSHEHRGNHTLRDKRQLLLLAAGAAAIIGGAAGIFSASQIAILRAELTAEIGHIHHRIAEHDLRIAKNSAAIGKLAEAMADLNTLFTEQHIIQQVVKQVEDMLLAYEFNVEDLVLGLLAMGRQGGHLSPLVIPRNVLSATVQKIREMAKERRVQTLDLDNLYSYPYTVVVEGQKIEILVHVLVVERYYNLFHFHSLPYLHNDTYVKVSTPHTHIAVAQGDDPRGVLLDKQELDSCTHYNMKDYGLWVCSNRLILRNVTDTCIGRIYSGKPHADVCTFDYTKEADEVFLVAPGSVVAFAGTTELHSWQYCQNGTLQDRVLIHHGKLMNISKGCRIVLAKNEYTSFDNYVVRAHYNLPLASRVVLRIPDHHRDIVGEILKSITTINSATVDYILEQQTWKQTHTWTLGSGYLVLAAIVFVALALYAYSYFRHRRLERLKEQQAG